MLRRATVNFAKGLNQYVEQGILPNNLFQQLDRAGVGKLIEMSVKLGRGTCPDLHILRCAARLCQRDLSYL